MFFSKKLGVVVFILILINLILGAWFVINGDIIYGFGGDIARDMYLLELGAIKKIVLIGAHSGGIPGVFHGPAWMYLNLPAFIIAQGNPVGVGWFWVILSISLLFITYYVAKRLFKPTTALIATLLLSVFLIDKTKELINPFGAVLVFPLFFYGMHNYLKKPRALLLALNLLLAGFMVQFQVAFGAPILILTTLLVVYKIVKTHRWIHLIAFLILLIPFSTYVTFEVRHEFLQIKALYNYISGTVNFAKQPFSVIISSRIKGFFVEGWYMFKYVPFFMSVGIVAIFSFFAFKARKRLKETSVYLLFLYYYCGYWLFMFIFYRGIVFEYYNWPFLPIVLIVFSSMYIYMNRFVFIVLYCVVYIYTLVAGYNATVGLASQYIGKNSGSWLFNKTLAEDVFNMNAGDFGYYVYTPDLYATGTKYAFYFMQKNNPDIKGFLNEKRKITYLIYTPVFPGLEFHNGTYWRQSQVRITKKPNLVKRYQNGFRVEKYILTEEEIKIPSENSVMDTFKLEE